MNINEELLKRRMMRGVVTGPVEQEKSPMTYCKGKLDNGRPCRVVMLGDEILCKQHLKERQALEKQSALSTGRTERPSEDTDMAKYRCGKTGCSRVVKNEGDMCWQHKGLEDQITAGTVEPGFHSGNHDEAKESGATDLSATAASDNLKQPLPESPRPTGLCALIRTPTPPQPPDGLLIPFTHEETVMLIESGVTREHIRELVVMGLAGQLMQVDDTDPLAMTRAHAAA
jgi:hypothetical protein